MPKLKKSNAVLVFAALLTVMSASADDLDIYKRQLGQAKILFALDVSGSMRGRRLSRMKAALKTLIRNIQGMEVGLMSYAGSSAQLVYPISNVTTNRDALLAAVDGLRADGYTPTVAAILEAQRYMTGGEPYRGSEPNGLSTYQPTASSECEAHHVVVLTDGEPTADSQVVRDLQPLLGSCAGDENGEGTCGVELAKYLSSVDQFTDIDDDNYITLHTIGLDINITWLQALATAGGGLYHNASSSQSLLDAFLNILEAADISATTAAPTISVNAFNQSRQRNELYYSFFQPSALPRWEGNIKKYLLVEGEIVDANGMPLVENSRISETSASLWSVDNDGFPVVDGEKVHHGGMAARQRAGKRWYTDAGTTFSNNGGTTPVLITNRNQNQISRQWFGAASNAERNTLVNWALGYDSIDRDEDGDSSEASRYIADGIHSSPVLISYQVKESDDLLREVLFTTNNMGLLYAVNPLNGDELWSYSPAELLPNIKKYADNNIFEHVYGLDGAIFPQITYKQETELDLEVEQVRLFLTQRRGGSNIFALDVTDVFSNEPIKRIWSIKGGIEDTKFRDLAQTWSTPTMVPIRSGCPDNCTEKNALLFGGGYNPLYDDESLSLPVDRPATGHGNAIYLVDPDNGALLWSAGKGTHHSLNLSEMNDSVPDTPVPIDTDADGIVNIIYFSDIAGNVWRIDLDSAAESTNDLAIAGDKIASLNEAGQNLRFFNRPDVSIDGVTAGVASLFISIGSGMRSSPLLVEPQNNRAFVIRDNWVFANPTVVNPDTEVAEPNYQYVVDADDNRSVITPGDLRDDSNGPTQYGFYKEFDPGEKLLQPTLTTASRVFVTSYMPPDPSVSIDPCEAPPIGESRLYILDTKTGENKLPSQFGNPYVVVGAGITDGGTIVDTGAKGGPDLLISTTAEKLVDFLEEDNPNVFRRFFRTGWIEIDD